MPTKNNTEKIKENSDYIGRKNSLGFLFNDHNPLMENTEKEQSFFSSFNKKEKENIKTKLNEFKQNISSLWLDNVELKRFYKKYHVSDEEANEYIGYFL